MERLRVSRALMKERLGKQTSYIAPVRRVPDDILLLTFEMTMDHDTSKPTSRVSCAMIDMQATPRCGRYPPCVASGERSRCRARSSAQLVSDTSRSALPLSKNCSLRASRWLVAWQASAGEYCQYTNTLAPPCRTRSL
ncbi:hypothetical protein BDV98DRAFT_570148 [Pterulicium gracile]|uniref:Uncharacterized protein n=1 Tax=Pterulicium gracile TaxID=1884261 RepID=A0A5C3QDT1_9AGAR|nr:hypothetical protein BDV98DRAFT_570148 [Pterula gracilis]